MSFPRRETQRAPVFDTPVIYYRDWSRKRRRDATGERHRVSEREREEEASGGAQPAESFMCVHKILAPARTA